MISSGHALYAGHVVHNRLHPVSHRLRYRVFSLLLDVDRLEQASSGSRLFSYNGAGLLSLHDRDHGDGTSIAAYLRKLAREAGRSDDVTRFVMLCYPRVLGYVFNPLTVYAGLDETGDVRLVIYEVSNTFGERMTYVLQASSDSNGTVEQTCAKQFYVSPFNTVSGDYRFRLSSIGEHLKLAIRLEDAGRAVMTAYFSGTRKPFSDAVLAAELMKTGWMTLKVIAGIHVEAARLWLKGLRITPRPRPPEPAVTFHVVSSAKNRKS